MSARERDPEGSEEGRVLALDYGRRRIGLAVSDPGRVLATPHSAVENADPPVRPPRALLRAIAEIDPVRVVVGVPLEMDGSPGAMAREVREFGERLAAETELPVEEWDERLSSARASRILLEAEPRRSRRERKGRLDRTAAAVILRAWLDAGGGGRPLGSPGAGTGGEAPAGDETRGGREETGP